MGVKTFERYSIGSMPTGFQHDCRTPAWAPADKEKGHLEGALLLAHDCPVAYRRRAALPFAATTVFVGVAAGAGFSFAGGGLPVARPAFRLANYASSLAILSASVSFGRAASRALRSSSVSGLANSPVSFNDSGG